MSHSPALTLQRLVLAAALLCGGGGARADCDALWTDRPPLYEGEARVTATTPFQRRLLLPPGREVIVIAQENGIDVRLTLEGEGQAFSADNPLRGSGQQRVKFQPTRSTAWTARIVSADESPLSGDVLVRVVSVPLIADRCSGVQLHLAEADRAFARGQAISIAPPESSPAGEARSFYQNSVQSYRNALTALGHPADTSLRAMITLLVGATYYWGLDDFVAAGSWARDAAQTYRKLGDARGLALAQTLQGMALIETDPSQVPGNLALAARLLRDSAEIQARQGDQRERANALNNLGMALHYSGDYSGAIAAYTAAMQVLRSRGERIRLWQVMGNRSLVDYELGNFGRAKQTYAELLAQPELEGKPTLYVNIMTNSALVDLVSGDAGRALKAYQGGIDTARRIQSIRYEALCLQGIGGAYEALGEPVQALDYYRRALQLRTRVNGARFREETLRTIADVERRLGNTTEALKLDSEALTLADADLGRMRARVRIATDYVGLARYPEALAQLESVLSHRIVGDRFVQTQAMLLRGRIRAASEEWAAARGDLAEALRSAEQLDWADEQFRIRIALVNMLREQGALTAALAEVDAAIELAERLRLQTANPGLQASLLETLRPAFDLKIDILAAMHSAARGEQEKRRIALAALHVSESARSRSLQEYARIELGGGSRAMALQTRRRSLYEQLLQFQSRLDATAAVLPADDTLLVTLRNSASEARRQIDQLETELASRYSTPARVAVQKLNFDRLPASLGLVEYWLGERNAYAWVATRGELHMVSLGSSGAIGDAAMATQRSLQEFTSSRVEDRIARLQALSRLVWAPLVRFLPHQRILIFVPDMALHYIPFSALRDTSLPARYLIETHDVATAPSLQLLQEHAERRRSGTGRLLLVADPDYGGRLPRLAATAAEADAIAALMPTGRVDRLQGRQATRENVLTADLRKYQYIHVASHAVADARIPQLSSLRLASADGHDAGADVLAADLLGVRMDASLVVLSACETSLGRVVSGEGVVGLRYVLLARGARAVASSLWRIGDRAAQQLMADFYSSLIRNNETATAALGAAMRSSMRRHGGDPAEWAGFDLAVRDMSSVL